MSFSLVDLTTEPAGTFFSDGVQAIAVPALQAGDLVVVGTMHGDRTVDIASVTATGCTFVEDFDVPDNSVLFYRVHYWSCIVETGGATSITITLDANDPNISKIGVWQLRENQVVPSFGTGSATPTGSATSFPSGTVAVSTQTSVLIGFALTSGGSEANDPAFVNDFLDTGFVGGHRILSGTGAFEFTPTAAFGNGFSSVVWYQGGAGQGDPHANLIPKALRPGIFLPGHAR